jgi:hypothetical protein
MPTKIFLVVRGFERFARIQGRYFFAVVYQYHSLEPFFGDVLFFRSWGRLFLAYLNPVQGLAGKLEVSSPFG